MPVKVAFPKALGGEFRYGTAMGGVTSISVAQDDDGIRLDRWFRRHFPDLSHGRLQKLLRTGQIRVDGRRAKAGQRLAVGQTVRIPPLASEPPEDRRRGGRDVPSADERELRSRILYCDDLVIALDKPAGLAVQGGTGTRRHLDAMLEALRFDATERPRLVHRLDKDTSGVLLLGRTASAAAALAKAFRSRDTRKIYWAVVVGVPSADAGRIDLRLAKRPGRTGERVAVDVKGGRRAITLYRTVEVAGRRLAWLALWPQTGRTHQLRVHCAALGTPILGDGKYAGRAAYLDGVAGTRRLHLHAREISVPHPSGHGMLRVRAPLPPHMMATWRMFGFDPDWSADPFPEER